MISGMQSEAVPKALELYRETHDSTRAVTYINQYEKQKAEIMRKEEARRREEEERKRREEEARIRAEERAAIEREAQIRREAEEEAARKAVMEQSTPVSPDPIPENETAEEEMPFVTPTTKSVFYRVVATDQELAELEVAMDSLGIYFERRES